MTTALFDNLVAGKIAERDALAAQICAAMYSQLSIDPPAELEMTEDDIERWLIPYIAWCGTNSIHPVSPCPATPAALALFLQQSNLPPDDLPILLRIISHAHTKNHFADPTTSYAVTQVLKRKACDLAPPRSWTKEAAKVWSCLPFEAKQEVLRIEQSRQKEVRSKQNEAAMLRQRLIELEVKDETKAA